LPHQVFSSAASSCSIFRRPSIAVGCGDGKVTALLSPHENVLVQGLDPSEANVRAARKHIASKGMYGRISVQQWLGEPLPYNAPISVLDAADGKTLRTFAEQAEILKGKDGSVLLAVAADSGERLSELKLKSIPVWDGMAAAYGRIYLPMEDGTVVCLGSEK